MVTIYIELDANQYVMGWSSTKETTMNQVELNLPEDHPFLTNMYLGLYQLINGSLILDENKLLANLKQQKKEELNQFCQTEIAKGFPFEVRGKDYWFGCSEEQQKRFEETKTLFENNTIESIIWSCKMETIEVMLPLDKKEFLTLYIFAALVKKQKIEKLNNDLYSLVDQSETKEEVQDITWNSIQDAPFPDIPDISDGSGGDIDLTEVNQAIEELEDSDKMQISRIDMNETALLEALDLIFSGAVASLVTQSSPKTRAEIDYSAYSNLIKIYAIHIIEGDRAIDTVPAILQPAVEEYIESVNNLDKDVLI
ncbi:hypothetical protein I4L69_001648 [Enterococcus faecium]|nr:hypothetical protein [Enterococcus faecium]